MVSSPVRFAKRSVDPGSVESSTFSLIIICMGATTVTVPLIFYKNGPILGCIFILFGGMMSLFSAYCIAFCCEYTGGSRYEDIALKLYGPAGLRFTSFCNILCN
jgi:amino acid permease